LKAGASVQRPDPAACDLPLDPLEQLYGPVLFQGGRFRRVLGYQRLAARECTARISVAARGDWFGGFHAADLVLADPGARDAMMHAIQCCVPDATLLPLSVDRLVLADPAEVRDATQLVLHAAERWRDGDTYLYDLDVRRPDGTVVERWEGLRLQAVRKQDGTGPWLPALLGPYLERNAAAWLGGAVRTAVYPDSAYADGAANTRPNRLSRRGQSSKALSWALGREVEVAYRADGRPLVTGAAVSVSHGAGTTFAVAADKTAEADARESGTSAHRVLLACDVELSTARSESEWAGLLGPDGLALARLVAAERGEDLSLAATRVWGAAECLRKTGRATVSLTASEAASAGPWTALRSGAARIASFATQLLGTSESVVFTLLREEGDAS